MFMDDQFQKMFFEHLSEHNKTLGDIREFMGDINSKIASIHDDRIELKKEIRDIKDVELKDLKKMGDAFWKFKAQSKVWGIVAFVVTGFLQSAVLIIFSRVLSAK